MLDNGPYDTRLRITAEAELNMMIKMLLKGKLEKGINQLAEGLAKFLTDIYDNKKALHCEELFGYLDRSSKSMSSNLFVSTSSWTAIVSPLRACFDVSDSVVKPLCKFIKVFFV